MISKPFVINIYMYINIYKTLYFVHTNAQDINNIYIYYYFYISINNIFINKNINQF